MPRFPDLATARAEIAQAYAGVTAAVDELDDEAWGAATRCDGWVRHDLVFHLLCEAQRLLVAVATPTAAGTLTIRGRHWPTRSSSACPPRLLAGARRPDWDDVTYALKATGWREAIDSDESLVLADVRLPLLS